MNVVMTRENGFPWRLFAFFFVVYICTSSCALRSSDAEIVYRAAEAFSRHGTWAVSQGCRWEGFGLATGSDGKLYSIFSPLPSLALVPGVWMADRLFPDPALPASDPSTRSTGGAMLPWWQRPDDSRWRPARSLWLEDGASREAHWRRMLIGPMQAAVGAGIVGFFRQISLVLTGVPAAATASALLLGLGTLLWPYSGTCFSEPLALLLVLLSVRVWLFRENGRQGVAACLSGWWLGLSAMAHLTSLLFVPFWGGWILAEAGISDAGEQRPAEPVRSATRQGILAAWLGGLGFPLVGLGLMQFFRYGNPLETGRTVDPEAVRRFAYGVWSFDWTHLYGLLFSAGKGLLPFCPLLVVSLLCWRVWGIGRPALGIAIASAAMFRILFIACRSDWHGGFSLGPRYLLPLVPLLMLGLGMALAKALKERRQTLFAVFMGVGCLAAVQQWYLCIGDIFQYSRALREMYQSTGSPAGDLLAVYDTWDATPLSGLHQTRCVIWALGWWPLGNLLLWATGAVLLLGLFVWASVRAWRSEEPHGGKIT